VRNECERASLGLGGVETLVLSGGTARAIGKLLGGGIASASAAQVQRLCDELSGLSPQQLAARGVDVTRCSTLAAGAAVVSGVLAGLRRERVRISPRGLREGVVLRELAKRATAAA
jgi:exopolyphosphatase/pppGpp-phosphohydrolase